MSGEFQQNPLYESRPVVRLSLANRTTGHDEVAAEEPLEISLAFGPGTARVRASLGVTLRTSGHDTELAVGFLLAEGIVREAREVLNVVTGSDGASVRVELHPAIPVDGSKLMRAGVRSGACGACGAAWIDATVERYFEPNFHGRVSARLIQALPDALRARQPGFGATGGLHAAGRFDRAGQILSVREDVGRHNALDKLLGAELLAGRIPADDSGVVVSGRVGFELVQKCAAAGVTVLVAVGAPTTLAVDFANAAGITLVGFTRPERMTIYTHPDRVEVVHTTL